VKKLLLLLMYFFRPFPSRLLNMQNKRYYDLSAKQRYTNTNSLIAKRLHNAEKTFVDFLQGLLAYDPQLRLSASEALRHPFLQPLGSSGNGSSHSFYHKMMQSEHDAVASQITPSDPLDRLRALAERSKPTLPATASSKATRPHTAELAGRKPRRSPDALSSATELDEEDLDIAILVVEENHPLISNSPSIQNVRLARIT
jgi:serine/threonine protein kinase